MTQLTITSQPLSGKNIVFGSGDLTVAITLGKGLKCSDSYTIMLYDEQLILLDDAATENGNLERTGRTLTARFSGFSVWLPGHYFLLLRNGTGCILRFNIQLDGEGRFRVEEPVTCPRMSDEDVLSGSLHKRLNYWRALSRMPGSYQFKRWVVDRVKQNMLNELRQSHSLEKLSLCDNLLIDWKSSLHAGPTIALLLSAADVEGKRKTANCENFYDTTKNNPYEELNDFFADTSSSDNIFGLELPDTTKSIYKLYGIGALIDSGGRLIMKKLLYNLRSSYRSTIFCGTPQEIDTMLEQYPSVRSMFPAGNRIALEPYARQELIYTFFESAHQKNLNLSAEAKEKVCRLLWEAYDSGAVCHWDRSDVNRYVSRHLQPAHCQRAISALADGQEESRSVEVLPDDIDGNYFCLQGSPYDKAIEELQSMVGLSEIKRSIVTLANRVKFYAERRQLGLQSSDMGVYHTILTGNPGTGKTTVARLLGRIYHSLGLLSKGDVICVDRKKIIGRYIGETEENMKMILREAQGNVLFVDEAYTLYTTGDERDFGRHAVECLLDVLSRKNPDMLIIFAGYEKEMDALMSMNPGLVGRFPYKFRFPNYTPDELMQIALKMLDADHYELTPEAHSSLLQTIRETVAARSETFANARWVEQFVMGGIIPALADRVSGTPHVLDRSVYQRIEAADVQTASARFGAKSIELRQRPAIGFCA